MAETLTRWEPFAELADLRSRFDRMLGELTGDRAADWLPAIDMVRDDGTLIIRADVPGIKPEEITIEIDEDTLVLSGKHEESKSEKEGDSVRRERRYGAFTRSMSLPKGIDAKKVKATTRDGVLKVRIALPEEAKHEPVTITPTIRS
jgi:HSP20 family protein